MTGRSPSGRAGRPTAQAPAGLGDTASNPNADDGPRCGPNFSPEDGCYECPFCGRFLHAECSAFWGEQ